jgi:hypothetical protein
MPFYVEFKILILYTSMVEQIQNSMEVKFKFKICSETKDRDGRELTLNVRFNQDKSKPETRTYSGQRIGIPRVEHFDFVPDKSSKDFEKFFKVNRNVFHQHELIVQLLNEKDFFSIELPEILRW